MKKQELEEELVAARKELEQVKDWLDHCIWVSPDRQFGRPCLGGRRITTEHAATGIDDEDAADGYDLTVEQLELARWFERCYRWTGDR